MPPRQPRDVLLLINACRGRLNSIESELSRTAATDTAMDDLARLMEHVEDHLATVLQYVAAWGKKGRE